MTTKTKVLLRREANIGSRMIKFTDSAMADVVIQAKNKPVYNKDGDIVGRIADARFYENDGKVFGDVVFLPDADTDSNYSIEIPGGSWHGLVNGNVTTVEGVLEVKGWNMSGGSSPKSTEGKIDPVPFWNQVSAAVLTGADRWPKEDLVTYAQKMAGITGQDFCIVRNSKSLLFIIPEGVWFPAEYEVVWSTTPEITNGEDGTSS